MFDVSLNFLEDFVDFDVHVRGFSSEAIAKEFTNQNHWLCLSATGLELVIGDRHSSMGHPIARNRVDIKLDTKWHERTPLNPSNPESMAKIMQSMTDYENGIKNPLNMMEDDYELVDWSFEETFRKLNPAKSKLAITQCLAYRITPSTGNDVDDEENISKFNHSVRTILSARQGMRNYRQTLIELAK